MATSQAAQTALSFFQGKGWSPAQAAGIVGNLQAESALNPQAFNGAGGGRGAAGIAQWRGSRQTDFQEFAGVPLSQSTYQQQLDFVNYELTQGKEKAEVSKGSVQAVKQEETEITDEMIFEVLEESGIDFESLSDNELQEVANEAYEILDELSKNTLGSYIKKANFAGGMADFKHGRIADRRGDSKEKTSLAATSHKRTKGISTAVNKLSKEEVEQVEERHMTDSEMEKKEKIVKSMKKGLSGFKERYGDKAKNVMYATATKQAMK